uniref:UDP-glucuronosyltransferase n=1 Tax=Trialeurodes vaporariorum TaxID=88556 RepID=A0A873P522_TRIVP|nr:UDP-gluconosyltransferase [Trialeurodes vaporariorum]
MLFKSIIVVFILGLSVSAFAYNILIIHPTPSLSHQRPVMALIEALVKRGHNLFVASPNVVTGLEQNYTYVDLSFTYSYVQRDVDTFVDLRRRISKWDLPEVFKGVQRIVGEQFKSTQFIQFYKRVKEENIKFDVAIGEVFTFPSACAMIRLLSSHTQPPPLISMSTVSYDYFSEEFLGSPEHASFTPTARDPYSNKMNIWQKINNWMSVLFLKPALKKVMDDEAKRNVREAHGPQYEALVDNCWSNVSLTLITSNFVYYYPRLHGPNVIELGPLHLKTAKELPQDLQDWLDGAEIGVIYFSLGSNMKSKSLPPNVRSNFLRYFKELPTGYRVLWKWELDGRIPGQSDNILAQKWMPQESILAHPKVKVFITQGGLQSVQETVHYGVPTVGIPWFGDQDMNVAKLVDAGIGTRLNPPELESYANIKAAVDDVLNSEKYSKNMRRLSAIAREFSSQGLDAATFWVEHVAKFGGAPHLRPSTADATLFEFFCFDIISVILIISVTILYLIRLALRCLIAKYFSSNKTKIKKS